MVDMTLMNDLDLCLDVVVLNTTSKQRRGHFGTYRFLIKTHMRLYIGCHRTHCLVAFHTGNVTDNDGDRRTQHCSISATVSIAAVAQGYGRLS